MADHPECSEKNFSKCEICMSTCDELYMRYPRAKNWLETKLHLEGYHLYKQLKMYSNHKDQLYGTLSEAFDEDDYDIEHKNESS